MSESQRSLRLRHCVCRFNEVLQQFFVAHGHDALRCWRRSVVHIPPDVADAPLLIQFVVGEERVELNVRIVALHVAGNVEEVVDEAVDVDAILPPCSIVEKRVHQPFRMRYSDGILAVEVARLVQLLHLSLGSGCQIELQRLAGVVVEAGRRVGSRQFLTFCRHREYASYDRRAAGVDGHILFHEDFRKVLHHPSCYAVMLAFAHRCQVACPFLRAGQETHQLLQRLLSRSRQFTFLLCLAHRLLHVRIAFAARQPSRTVSPVVTHVERFVACRRRRQRFVGQLVFVVQVIAGRKKTVSLQFLPRCLSRHLTCREHDGNHQDHPPSEEPAQPVDVVYPLNDGTDDG